MTAKLYVLYWVGSNDYVVVAGNSLEEAQDNLNKFAKVRTGSFPRGAPIISAGDEEKDAVWTHDEWRDD